MALLGKMFRLTEQEITCHYWIIISEPLGGMVLSINLTDGGKCQDSPCHLRIGEHQCITKPSAVNYRKSKEFRADILLAELENPRFLQFYEEASPALLSKIVEGAKQADDLTARFLNYLR